MSIEAVVFDFGQVISFTQEPTRTAWLQNACGLTPARFTELYYRHRPAYDQGRLDGPAYWRLLLAAGKIQPDDALLQQLIDTDTLSWCENLDTRMLDWAADLRQNGLQTGIFSNMPADILEYLRTQQSWLADFNFSVFSCEYDVVKPNAAIYQHLVKAAGLAPQHLLFLDDRKENIEAARTAGLQADIFTSYEALKDHWSWPIPAPS